MRTSLHFFIIFCGVVQIAQAANESSLRDGAVVQTKAGAQRELRFSNGTLVRLGQNSALRIGDGARRMELLHGAMLVRAPRSAGETSVVLGNVVSSVGGTTALLEYYPDAYAKLISLEGTARMFMPKVVGESVLVTAGQLLMFHLKPAPRGLPNPVDVDIKRLMATSRLINGFAPLGSEASMGKGAQEQNQQKSRGTLADTNLVIFGRGTLVSVVPPNAAPSPSPSPKPARSPNE